MVLSEVSGTHWGFWNIFLVDKGRPLYNASIRIHGDKNNIYPSRHREGHSEKTSICIKQLDPVLGTYKYSTNKISSYQVLHLGNLRPRTAGQRRLIPDVLKPSPWQTYCVSAPSSISTFSFAWLLRTVSVKR